MKTKIISVIILILIGFFTINAQTYKVDVIKSKLAWKSNKITGEHSGKLNFVQH